MLAIHNKKFKNNEKFERYNYLDYMVEESTFLEVDCSSKVNSLFLANSTNNGVQTTDKSELELDVRATADDANDSSVCNILIPTKETWTWKTSRQTHTKMITTKYHT